MLSKKLSTTKSAMNYELKKIAEWLSPNKLSLNSGKSELVIFHTKTTKKNKLDEITIKITKSKLSLVPNVIYLGVVLDEHLSWDA